MVNVFLILGSVKEIRFALIIWIIFTIITLIWEFVLLSILFSYDTTIGMSFTATFQSISDRIFCLGFVLTLALLHLLNFCLLSYFIIVVFSYYQVSHSLADCILIIYFTGADSQEGQTLDKWESRRVQGES